MSLDEVAQIICDHTIKAAGPLILCWCIDRLRRSKQHGRRNHRLQQKAQLMLGSLLIGGNPQLPFWVVIPMSLHSPEYKKLVRVYPRTITMSNSSLEQKIQKVSQRLDSLDSRFERIEQEIFGPLLQEVVAVKKATEPPTQERSRFAVFLRCLKRPISLVTGGVVTGLSLLTAWTGLRYDVSVAPYGSLDASAPFESRFLVRNEGPFSIFDVTYFCRSARCESTVEESL